ncbi:DTW domain-containing protein YfiP [Marinimicrobium koreense]|jgi:DTW domain-containing protein YfiP|uniref:tRNA-uridine aminocarboxypropyltransferase n=1 Tax=Marinimicrobium koreense TaxID=306545 RepID=A0A3N1P644_9GAMM|nr:tRNA-uridine aminocarboxypropyltransferase [Marinimicrobium koreense]ROQ20286.1 DTW domain-containing protein YfiP [Marinimicrobium koreense]
MSRALCPRCERPERACICHWVRPIDNGVSLLILQHPDEAHRAKNSARLLDLSLQNSQRVVGEQWSDAALGELLNRADESILLYPETDDLPAPRYPDPNDLTERNDTGPRRQLVVLDATWRKSRKMLYLNPPLHALPRLALTDTPPSRYRIRRARKPGQLSTLEACCYALAHLEGERVDYEPLLDAFDGFNDQQLAFRPKP